MTVEEVRRQSVCDAMCGRYLCEVQRGQGSEVERSYVLGDNAKSEVDEDDMKEYIQEARSRATMCRI